MRRGARRACALAGFLVAGGGALACQCPTRDRATILRESHFVLVARVIDARASGGGTRARVERRRAIKGTAPRAFEVFSASMLACGLDLRAGQTLMLATNTRPDGQQVDGCAHEALNPPAGRKGRER